MLDEAHSALFAFIPVEAAAVVEEVIEKLVDGHPGASYHPPAVDMLLPYALLNVHVISKKRYGIRDVKVRSPVQLNF